MVSAPDIELTPSGSLQFTTGDSVTPSLRAAWQAMLASSDDPFALHQSPEWFDLMRREHADNRPSSALAVLRDEHGELAGIVPLFRSRERCSFVLGSEYLYKTAEKEMIRIASGSLLLPPGSVSFDEVFHALAGPGPPKPLIKIENVPLPCPFFDYLQDSRRLRRDYFVCKIPGFDRVDVIPLPSSYEGFLGQYSAKKRYNLRRQIRLLQERTGGRLALRRYVTESDVPALLDDWEALVRAQSGGLGVSPQAPVYNGVVRERQRWLARLGLLRCYGLKHEERPIALVLGQHHGRIYRVGKTLHDPHYYSCSPGTGLLHMLIEELINSGGTALINLGYGSPGHEFRSPNRSLAYASYWLIPRTWKSRLFMTAHTGLRRAVGLVKMAAHAIGARRPQAVPGEDRRLAGVGVPRPDLPANPSPARGLRPPPADSAPAALPPATASPE